MKKVAIIIVNYKDYAERFLADCINSLRKQQAENIDWQLYIVDNASSAESRAYLKKQAPEAEVILREDGNYSAANKAGIERAMRDGRELFVIANMDVIFERDWLKELVNAAQSDKKIGIAQSKIMLWPEKNKINSVGNIMHFLGFGFTKGYREIDPGEIAGAVHGASGFHGAKEIAGYASGCSMIIKKEVIEKIGNYDPEYYMYHDDLEMGWRAKLAGYKIALAPKSIVYHKYNFSRSARMLYYMERNRYLAFFSFYRLPTIMLLLPSLIKMDIGMLLFSVAKGWFIIKLKIYWYFLHPSSWAHIFAARRQVRKYRKLKDRDVVKNFAGKVEFQEIMNPVLKYIVNPIFYIYWQIVRKIIFW